MRKKKGEKIMKKLLATVVSLCMLAVLVPFVPVNAETVPWDSHQEIAGTARIGQTITVPKARVITSEEGDVIDYGTEPTELYYKLNLTAGQAVYFSQPYTENDENDENNVIKEIYGNYKDGRTDWLYQGHYYAVKDETIYIKFYNRSTEDAHVTVSAGQTFSKTVTKEDKKGDNFYFYKPSVTGEYTFRISSSDPEARSWLDIMMLKGADSGELNSRDVKNNGGFGYEEMTAVLQAGTQYVIQAGGDTYCPYTLSLVSAPAQPESSVKVAKPKIKSVVSKKAKTAVVTWKKAKGATGYQVTYSAKKNFKKAKSVTVSAKKTKAVLKKLAKGKKYYVKVRTLKKVNGKTYSSAYSRTLKVKVK